MRISGIFNLERIRIIMLLALIFLIFENGISQNKFGHNTPNKSEENIDFYKFVIDEYIWLIKKVYRGDTPFFVVIEDVFSDEKHANFSIDLTYTMSFEKLSKYKNTIYYSFNQDSNIYIVINRFQGDSTFKTNLVNIFHATRISVKTLQELFYPLTDEFFFDSLNVKQNNAVMFFTDDLTLENAHFVVSKYQDNVLAKENGRSIKYFTNYQRGN